MSLSSALGLAGNYFFGPIGGFIGSTIGTLLGPQPDDIENFGPRLGDRRVQVASYGQSRPIVYGTMQLAGTVIEPQNFELAETTHVTEESGGKGGGPSTTTTTYSYSATFATLLCEGPIIGVRKIWLDSKLVYDFSASASASAIAASNKAATGIRIYTGSESQTVDSILESLNGAGNTPAYRGSAYIVFDTLQLEKFGNRLPNVRVEVVASGSSSIAWKIDEHIDHETSYESKVITDYDNGVYRIWDQVESPTGNIYLIDGDGNYLGSEPVAPKGARLLSQDGFPTDKAGVTPYSIGTLGTGIGSWHIYGNNYFQTSSLIYLKAIYWDDTLGEVIGKDFSLDVPTDRKVLGVSISADHKRAIMMMGEVGVAANVSNATGIWYMYDENLDKIDEGTCNYDASAYANGHTGGDIYAFGFGNLAYFHAQCTMMENDYKTIWAVDATGTSNMYYYTIDENNVFSIGYLEDMSNSNMGSLSANRGTTSIYADDGVAVVIGRYASDVTKGYVSTFSRELLYTTTSATLSDIVDDIEDRVGVDSASRDNSALTDTVDGYMISRLTTARRSIEPLQTAFFFDAIETGYKIKAVNRGGASVATLPITDMGAISYGAAHVFPLDKKRLQEIEIPKEIICKYISPARGYEVATQRSRRIETLSSEIKNIDLPISMSDNKGKQVVEVLHFNFWTERNIYSFSLMPEYAYLDPSDVITVTDGSDTYTIRITKINLSLGGVIQCEGVADRAAVYSSTSDGVDNDANAVTVTEIGPTKAIYGDWPMLLNGQNNEAIYIAASGLLSGWSGGVVYRSVDMGGSYSQLSVMSSAATIGFTTGVLADGYVSTFDHASTVNVNMQSGTLSSTTELAVLNGANAAMIGSELVQFATATLESDGTYTLSDLLRGRKGTEWAMAGHVNGESFVLLDSTIRRPSATLNVERQYKAVSVGNFLADTYPVDFTYTGVNLKPYAPTAVEAARDTSNDIVLSWIRRSRFETSPLWSPIVGEDSEEYEIDIYTDGTYATIARAVTGLSSPTYTYTSALQTTDFGSPQATIYIKIYQKSATIGRGYEVSEAA